MLMQSSLTRYRCCMPCAPTARIPSQLFPLLSLKTYIWNVPFIHRILQDGRRHIQYRRNCNRTLFQRVDTEQFSEKQETMVFFRAVCPPMFTQSTETFETQCPDVVARPKIHNVKPRPDKHGFHNTSVVSHKSLQLTYY